jgi:hypothetical protein
LHRSHNFTGRGANHRKAKDAIVAVADKGLHKALSLISRLRAEYRVHRQPCDACHDALAFRFAFTQPDMGERGVSEHAIWNQPITRASVSSSQIVTYDSKIVMGYVGELWAAGTLPQALYVTMRRAGKSDFVDWIEIHLASRFECRAGRRAKETFAMIYVRNFRNKPTGKSFEVVSDEPYLPPLRKRLVQECGCEPDWENESIYEHEAALDVNYEGQHQKIEIKEL